MRRFFSSAAAAPSGPLASLATVEKQLAAPTITTASLREALTAYTHIEAAYAASSRADYSELPAQRDVSEARRLLVKLLKKRQQNPQAKLTNQTLYEFFTSKYPPSLYASDALLEAFNAQSSKSVVPESLAMIPFRRAVYSADFRGALDIVDRTCGSLSNYDQFKTRRLQRMVGGWGVGMGASLTGVYSLLSSGLVGTWDPSTSLTICGMVGTYLAALTVYGSMALAGSKSGLGLVLEWLPGTSMLYRYKHGEQLKMATFVTELNRSLPENLGEPSPQLLQDLKQMKLKPVETADETMLNEYWARGGEGFDWAEPDQDPADLLWRNHMEATRQQRLTSAYSRKDTEGKLLSWASEVEREKQGQSIPHASLLGVEELRSPEGMKSFEAELEQDMKQIREQSQGYKQLDQDQSDDEKPKGLGN